MNIYLLRKIVLFITKWKKINGLINVREYRRAIKNGQSRETGNIGYTGRRIQNKNKNTTQYVLDTTIRKQTQITLIFMISYGQIAHNVN